MGLSNEQKRASKAWDFVSTALKEGGIERYSSLAKSAPVMILTNGLGQTMAFFRSKRNGRNEYSLLYEHLDTWLTENVNWTGNSGSTGLMERIISESSQGYRMATDEALAILAWIKRFAAAPDPSDFTKED